MEVKGAARGGKNLLAGLLRCGHCGKKLQVRYSGPAGAGGYECKGEANDGGAHCSSFGAVRIDAAIEEKILEVIEPAGLEAAIRSVEQSHTEQDEKRKAKELGLEQARYEAGRASRQFHAVDPENRLVSSELEKRWNMALERVQSLEKELALVPAREEIGVLERERLMALAQDMPSVWFDEHSDLSVKKRIMRTLIEEVIVDTHKYEGTLEAVIHWAGGQHSVLHVQKHRIGEHRYTTDKDTVELVRELAEVMRDGDIARELNRHSRKTGHGNTWNKSRVCSLRNSNNIAVYDPQTQEEKGLITMQETARRLGICAMSVRRLIHRNILSARQVIPGTSWIISAEQLNAPTVQAAVAHIKNGRGVPLTEDQNQEMLDFQ